MKGRTFSGCIYGADVDANGLLTSKWDRLGEVYPFSITISSEIVKIRGRTCNTDGKIIGTKIKPTDAAGAMTLFDYTAKNIAKSLQGMVTTRNVSETTLASAPVELGKFSEFSEIGKEDLSVVVVKDVTDTNTHVLNVDYWLDPVLGLIAPVIGGAISEASTVHISAIAAANTDERVTIGAGTSKKMAIKGNLRDDFTGETVKMFLRMVLITSVNEVVLLSDEGTEREQIDFELAPEVPTGQTDYGIIDGLPV